MKPSMIWTNIAWFFMILVAEVVTSQYEIHTSISNGECSPGTQGCFSFTFSSLDHLREQLESNEELREYFAEQLNGQHEQSDDKIGNCNAKPTPSTLPPVEAEPIPTTTKTTTTTTVFQQAQSTEPTQTTQSHSPTPEAAEQSTTTTSIEQSTSAEPTKTTQSVNPRTEVSEVTTADGKQSTSTEPSQTTQPTSTSDALELTTTDSLQTTSADAKQTELLSTMNQIGNSDLWISCNRTTFSKAKNACLRFGGILFPSYLAKDINSIWDDISGEKLTWIGLEKIKGEWFWSNGVKSDNKNTAWADGQPDTDESKKENCGVLYRNKEIHDYPCWTMLKYICKI